VVEDRQDFCAFDVMLQPSLGEGAGVGLSIVQEIVAAHGGPVHLESVVRHDTTVILTLPRASATAPAQVPAAQ
jgi:signal transduction histidine kinase